MYTIKLKLVGFPKGIKKNYIELNPEDFFSLLKTNTININNSTYKVINKKVDPGTLNIEIVFDALLNAIWFYLTANCFFTKYSLLFTYKGEFNWHSY